MSCYSKEKMERNDCVNSNKTHLARSEREMYRVCPSKLSKRELEDLYFTFVENNLKLKKTINGQQDKIRMLSTQVQRMTSNQEKLINKEMKECCTGTKAFVNEQKLFITELKETNQRMAERIQHLNMRLSSAKQFQKTTLPQAPMTRPNVPFRVSSLTPKKHDCINKTQEAPQPISQSSILKLSTFCQWEDKFPKKSTQTQISLATEKSPKSEQPCDANRCKSRMEELKLKVATLQEELSIVHNEYSTRISRLENEVAEVRKENVRVSSERTASQHELQNTVKQSSDILAKFRRSEAKCAELAAELSIEKRKVTELDTLLKAANISDRVNKTIEEHMTTLTSDHEKCKSCCFPDPAKSDKDNSPRGARTRLSPTKEIDNIKSKQQSNTADDSQPFHDSDETALLKQNKYLLVKVLELQNKVDFMKKGVIESPEAKLSRRTSMDSPPLLDLSAENNKGISPKCARFTPTKDKDDTKSTVTADDSGYQESDEMASESPETKLVRHASVDSTTGHINCSTQLKSQSESEREIEKSLPFPPMASEERVNRPRRQKLRIEVLGNPKGSETSQIVEQPISSDETRAKTVQRFNSLLQVPEDRFSITSYEIIVNYDSTIDYKTPKHAITEKKKNDVADSNQSDIGSDKSGIEPGLILNPEKLKYLENEGFIVKADLKSPQAKLEEDTGSLTESVPSNPELGFGIPRLASKEKKGEIHSGQAKTSTAGPSPQRVDNSNLEMLPGKLKLPMTETLAGNYLAAPKETDETKKKVEDCEYCAACSYDKECESKHENALSLTTTMNKLGMQKEQLENRDLLKAIQIPDAIPISDYNKSHLMNDINRKHKTGSLTKDEMLSSQNVQAQKTNMATGLPVNLADVPLLDQRENYKSNSFLHRKDSIKVAKKTMLKKEKSLQKQKKDDVFTEDPILYAKHTCDTAVGTSSRRNTGVFLPDVPLLRNRDLFEETNDIEKNDNQEIPRFEIKMPKKEARLVERTADVAQSSEHKLPEKASQAITTTTYKADAPRVSIRESARQRNVSMYRRTSGTISFRSVPVSQDQPTCDCPGNVNGCCTDHSKNKGVQKYGDEVKKLGFSRDRHRQPTVEQGTYTVGSNRAETPDTDREISYFSDLPLEDENKSPSKSRPLSPGEDRPPAYTSTTQSDSSQPTTTRQSLSEGEMPANVSRRSSVVIEKPYLNPTLAHKLETPPALQMETALNAITDELQRCKNLLHANRSVEVKPLSTVILKSGF